MALPFLPERGITMTNESFEKIITEIESAELSVEEMGTLRDTIEGNRSNMTKEQYDAILAALDKAQESTRPFLVVSNENLAVAGDANDTKLNKYDYEIEFRKPVYENGTLTGYEDETKEYKNVFVTPRQQSKIVKILAHILPYFRKVSEDGSIENYTDYELAEIFANFEEEVYDLMYELCAVVFGIPKEEKEYMKMSSVIVSAIRFIGNTPELANEAESFFE